MQFARYPLTRRLRILKDPKPFDCMLPTVSLRRGVDPMPEVPKPW